MDHYYKYKKYKDKYNRLKQFKYNNDLEGGVLGYWYFQIIEDSMNLSKVPPDEMTESLCLTAVRRNVHSFKYVPEHIITREMCLLVVKYFGDWLKEVPEKFRDYNMCYAAIAESKNQDYMTLKYVPEKHMSPDLIEIAVQNDSRALQFVPKHLRTGRLCLIAVKKTGSTLEFVPEHLKDLNMCTTAVKDNSIAFNYVPKNIQNDLTLIEIYKEKRSYEENKKYGQDKVKVVHPYITVNNTTNSSKNNLGFFKRHR